MSAGRQVIKAAAPSDATEAVAAGDEAEIQHFEFAETPGGTNALLTREDFDQGPVLGIGAFGYVALTHYKRTGKTYALKTLTKKSILKTDQLTHCRDEIANLRAASNPFIVNLYSCFQDEMLVYMVMEFVAGGELYSIIQRGRLAADASMVIAAELLMVCCPRPEFCAHL